MINLTHSNFSIYQVNFSGKGNLEVLWQVYGSGVLLTPVEVSSGEIVTLYNVILCRSLMVAFRTG